LILIRDRRLKEDFGDSLRENEFIVRTYLRVWLMLLFKVFFIWKSIKIIFFFNISTLKRFRNTIKVIWKKIIIKIYWHSDSNTTLNKHFVVTRREIIGTRCECCSILQQGESNDFKEGHKGDWSVSYVLFKGK
jgi:hypothetical protein